MAEPEYQYTPAGPEYRPGGGDTEPPDRGSGAGSSITCADAALYYASRGWSVLPLFAGSKAPAVMHGYRGATTDPEMIKTIWEQHPEFGVGILHPKVIVIDVDPHNGGEDTFRTLIARHGPLPRTMTSLSGRGDGGRHLFFRRPDGLRNVRAGALGAGIDVLPGDRRFVVAPPTRHMDTGVRYRWMVTDRLATLPDWVTDLVRGPTEVDRHRSGAGRRAGVVGRNIGRIRRMATAVEGERNRVLSSIAGAVFRDGEDAGLVARHGRADFTGPLVDAALEAGLDAGEINATLESAWRYGLRCRAEREGVGA